MVAFIRKRRQLIAALAAIAALWAAGPAAAQESEGIRFENGIPTAMRLGKQEGKVTAVFFYLPTCQWCRKMSAGTFTDSRVSALASKFVWAKVDIDARPDLAAAYRVPGVPYFILFNTDGQAISTKGGYTTPEQLAKYLGDWAGKADAPGAGVAMPKAAAALKAKVQSATQPSDLRSALAEPVTLLSQAEPDARTVMLEQIKQLGPPLWEPLAGYLTDDRLSVRAAASEALTVATGSDLAFEPFGDAPMRSKQVQAWQSWIARNKNRPVGTTMHATTSPATRPLGS